jgi:hypothetical protein
MDKGTIAESILSLAMEPTQAAIVTGDLIEADASRNPVWFWSNVFQTLMAAAWREAKKQPIFVLSLAVRGALVQQALTMPFGFALVYTVLKFSWGRRLLVFPIYTFLGLTIPFYSGQWIARRSLSKDFAVCAAMALALPFVQFPCQVLMVRTICHYVFSHLTTQSLQGIHVHFAGWTWWDIAPLFASLLGAALIRRHRQTPSSPAC